MDDLEKLQTAMQIVQLSKLGKSPAQIVYHLKAQGLTAKDIKEATENL